MSHHNPAATTPTYSYGKTTVQIIGYRGSPHLIPERAAALIAGFAKAANITGDLIYNVTGDSHKIHLLDSGIRIKAASGNHSCSLIVRVKNGQQYAGYIMCKGGDTSKDGIFAQLDRITSHHCYYPPAVARNGDAGDLKPGVVATASAEHHDDQGSTVPTVAMDTEADVTPTDQTTANPIANTQAGDPEKNESLLGLSKDFVLIKLIMDAIMEMFPDGVAPVKMLATRLVNKMKLKVTPRALGPVLMALCNQGRLQKSTNEPFTYTVVKEIAVEGGQQPQTAVVQPVEKVKIAETAKLVTAPPTIAPLVQLNPTEPIQQEPTIPAGLGDFMAQWKLLMDMSEKLGEAADNCGHINARIGEIEAEIGRLKVELEELK